jgi:hypothetical protein
MLLEDLNPTKPRIIVTYPGRFQPFHQGHFEVFKTLQQSFGANNVFILTSDKTDTKKSPFNFQDKITLMTAAGVPRNKIIETSNMYSLPEEFNAANTIFIAAVGSPDADRLKPDSVTSKDITDKNGNLKPAGSPSYYKMWTGVAPVTADKHGYVTIIPEIQKTINILGQTYDVSHGTECRNLWNQIRNNPDARVEYLKQLYGNANKNLANILDKIPYTVTNNEDLSPMGQSTVSPISGNVKEEAAGVGVIANKKQKKDPRYSHSLTKDVKPGAIQHALRGFRLAEGRIKETEVKVTPENYHDFVSPNQPSVPSDWLQGMATGKFSREMTKHLQRDPKTGKIANPQTPSVTYAGPEEEMWTNPEFKDIRPQAPYKLPEAQVNEKWSNKYKKSINCNSPKGFSQKAHCQGRKARQAGKHTKSKKVLEDINQDNFITLLSNMLTITMEQLKLDVLPPIHLHKHIAPANGQATFGRYLNDSVEINLALGGRHPVDILRTLAHELVHFKQHLDHKLDAKSGDTGSPEENEAHAKAGIIMRIFNKKYPHAVELKPIDL